MHPQAAALADAARALQRSVQSHKRAANAHKRAAKEQMRALADLQRFCERHGISIDTHIHEAPRRQGDPRRPDA